MTRQPVEGSSTIAELGHEGDTLEVVFKSGQPADGKSTVVYRFQGVAAPVHAAMLEADSMGRYFQAEIRNARLPDGSPVYKFEKLTEPRDAG